MALSLRRILALGAAGVATVAALTALGLTALRPGPAEAQSLSTVPACQCSAPTALSGVSATVVHCLCGSMACVVAQPAGQPSAPPVLQCVR